jgi:hypothetical protein
MDINKFNAWLKGASPDALARAERALDTGVRRVITRHWETRLESGRWHWMRREVIRKRGTRDYVEDLKANGWAVTTVYEQIRDWLDSQNYLLPIESVPDEVNPREQAIKAAIAEARKAREGRNRAPKPELEDNVRIPWPALYGNRTLNENFLNAWKINQDLAFKILYEAYELVALIDQIHYEEDLSVDFSMQL